MAFWGDASERHLADPIRWGMFPLMAWRAIFSEPRREFVARDELLKRGIRALCPYELITEERNRARGRGKRIVQWKRPYFRSYLFAETDEIKFVESLSGVVCVVDNGQGAPLEVRPTEMRQLFAVVDHDGMISALDATRWSYRFEGGVGDIFEFISGGWAGHCGKIVSLERLDSRGEIDAEITIFGSDRVTSVPVGEVGSIVRRSDDRPVLASVAL